MSLALLLGSLLKLSQLDWGGLLGLCVASCTVVNATTTLNVTDVLSALWTELLFSAAVAGIVRLADAIKGTSAARL